MTINQLDQFEKVYYMRAIMGIIAGARIGVSISPSTGQGSVIAIIIVVGIVFYIISHWISNKIIPNNPKSERGPLARNGIFPFIFLLLMFMIIAYTGVHQSSAM